MNQPTQPAETVPIREQMPDRLSDDRLASFLTPLPVATELEKEPEAELAAAGSVDEEDSGQTWGRIVVLLIVAVLLVNVPVTELGASLLHLIPEASSVVVREGMVLQGSNDTLYLLHDHQLRPFSSDEAFRRFRGTQERRPIQPVSDRILAQFGQGSPIYYLVRCADESDVFALIDGEKRPFSPLPDEASRTQTAWDHVYLFSCQRLHDLPEGPPIIETGLE